MCRWRYNSAQSLRTSGATLVEHTIRYKKNLPINAEIETELKECADSSREWDSKNGTSTAHLNIIRLDIKRTRGTSIHFRCLFFYVVSEIIPKCFRASVIALSFSGGALWLLAFSDFGFVVALTLNNAVLLLLPEQYKDYCGFGNISIRADLFLDNFMKGR